MPEYGPGLRGGPNRFLTIRQLTHEEITNSTRRYPITVLAHDWVNPLNVGALFRLADAAGLQQLVLSGTTPRPPHPKIRRTARATERSVPFATVDDPVDYLRTMRAAGVRVVAVEITDESHSLFDYRLARGEEIVLVAGAESGGVAPTLLRQCDEAVHLPMHGLNTSMNVSVALGAAVYLLLMQLQ